MEIPHFYGDEDKDEISHVEWLRMVKESGRTPSRESNYFSSKAWEWWFSIDKDTRWNCSWEEIEKLFSNKWIKDTKMEELYRIQDELKESNEEIKKSGEELSKI
jgi:hypothetical protein